MTRFNLAREFEALWQGRSPATLLLLPLSWLFGLAIKLRRWYWTSGPGRPQRLPVPVIVVGNITVGGTGKTPVVDWLARVCRTAGFVPGIVSRGYGGRARSVPHLVQPDDDPAEVGDEPLLLRRRTGVPVCICPDRVAAGKRLLTEGVDLVIADDGLQHYRLARDMEIAVVDGERGFGNGLLLPAGPLRANRPAGWRKSMRYCAMAAKMMAMAPYSMSGSTAPWRWMAGERRSLESFRGQQVRALAGIGNPRRFYAQLAAAGMEVIPVPVADHRSVSLAELFEHADTPVFMTEKGRRKISAPGGLRAVDCADGDRHAGRVPRVCAGPSGQAVGMIGLY
jgi:tetraacyldisaccharide 4'-kinase